MWKTPLGLIGFVLLAPLAASDAQAGSLNQLGQPIEAPELLLPDIRDQAHDLNAYRGSVVLVNFWASWCPPCLVEMPGLRRLAAGLETRPFSVLAINVGERKNQVRRTLKLTGFDQTVLLDSSSEASDQWGAHVFPTSYLIDKAGQIRFKAVGPLDWEGDGAAAAIEALLAEAPPPAITTTDAACYAGAPSSQRGCQP